MVAGLSLSMPWSCPVTCVVRDFLHPCRPVVGVELDSLIFTFVLFFFFWGGGVVSVIVLLVVLWFNRGLWVVLLLLISSLKFLLCMLSGFVGLLFLFLLRGFSSWCFCFPLFSAIHSILCFLLLMALFWRVPLPFIVLLFLLGLREGLPVRPRVLVWFSYLVLFC